MVLVGNKCDLQAWAVDMNQARDVSFSLNFIKNNNLMNKFSKGGKAVRSAIR